LDKLTGHIYLNLIFLLVTGRKGKLQTAVLRFYNYDTKNNCTSTGDRAHFFIALTFETITALRAPQQSAKKTPKLLQNKH